MLFQISHLYAVSLYSKYMLTGELEWGFVGPTMSRHVRMKGFYFVVKLSLIIIA